MNLTRRNFLQIAGAALVSGKALSPAEAHGFTGMYATIIDSTRCDGCIGEPIPRCVRACRDYNKNNFPEPVKKYNLIGRISSMKTGRKKGM